MTKQAYVFGASLGGYRGVSRTVAVRGDQTLAALHDALQLAFGWDDDHLYSFWLSGKFWDRDGIEYTRPFELEPGQRSASRARLDRLGLEVGQRIAYVFDFGDQWGVRLTLKQIAEAEDGVYPQVLESRGEAPPQYAWEDDLVETA